MMHMHESLGFSRTADSSVVARSPDRATRPTEGLPGTQDRSLPRRETFDRSGVVVRSPRHHSTSVDRRSPPPAHAEGPQTLMHMHESLGPVQVRVTLWPSVVPPGLQNMEPSCDPGLAALTLGFIPPSLRDWGLSPQTCPSEPGRSSAHGARMCTSIDSFSSSSSIGGGIRGRATRTRDEDDCGFAAFGILADFADRTHTEPHRSWGSFTGWSSGSLWPRHQTSRTRRLGLVSG